MSCPFGVYSISGRNQSQNKMFGFEPLVYSYKPTVGYYNCGVTNLHTYVSWLFPLLGLRGADHLYILISAKLILRYLRLTKYKKKHGWNVAGIDITRWAILRPEDFFCWNSSEFKIFYLLKSKNPIKIITFFKVIFLKPLWSKVDLR